MGALSDERVAEYFSQHFVAAHQQVGTFEVINVDGNLRKNGGNVASYFLTPQGRVIHSVTGPVDASTLLTEARWAVDTFKRAPRGPWSLQSQYLATAHEAAADVQRRGAPRNARRIHQLLADDPLPMLADVYEQVFTRILGERLIRSYDTLRKAKRALEDAQKRSRPLLLVLHSDGSNEYTYDRWRQVLQGCEGKHRCRIVRGRCTLDALNNLADSYVGVALPLRELSAISQYLNVEPYEVPRNSSTLLIIARSDGRQVDVVTSWQERDRLTRALTQGLIAQAEHGDWTAGRLRTNLLRPLLRGQADESLVQPVQELIAAREK